MHFNTPNQLDEPVRTHTHTFEMVKSNNDLMHGHPRDKSSAIIILTHKQTSINGFRDGAVIAKNMLLSELNA